MSEEKMREALVMREQMDISPFNFNPNYTITFYDKCNNIIGALDFNGAQMEFTGDASESAKIFFDFVAESFSARFDAQPPAVVELTDEEILNVMRDGYGCRENDWQDHINFARAIIAKQQEKGHAE